MGYRVLDADDAFWRPSNQMRCPEHGSGQAARRDRARRTALAAGARAGVAPATATCETTELYVVLEGTGRLAVDGDLLTLSPLSAVLVEPDTVRQPFNDTDAEQLWLVVGAPPEAANTLEMTPELLAGALPRRTARAA